MIRELAASGMTMILATHEMGFARDIADTVCFLDGGRIRAGAARGDLHGPARRAHATVLGTDHRGEAAVTSTHPSVRVVFRRGAVAARAPRDLRALVAVRRTFRAPRPTRLVHHGGHGGIPMLVTCDEHGELRSFLNVCRHRGAVLADGCGRPAARSSATTMRGRTVSTARCAQHRVQNARASSTSASGR